MSKQIKKSDTTKPRQKPLKLSGSLDDLLKVALLPQKTTHKAPKK